MLLQKSKEWVYLPHHIISLQCCKWATALVLVLFHVYLNLVETLSLLVPLGGTPVISVSCL